MHKSELWVYDTSYKERIRLLNKRKEIAAKIEKLLKEYRANLDPIYDRTKGCCGRIINTVAQINQLKELFDEILGRGKYIVGDLVRRPRRLSVERILENIDKLEKIGG